MEFIFEAVAVMFILLVLASPLAAFKRTRGPFAAFMIIFSHVLAVTAWLWAFGVTLVLWGWGAVIVGFVLLGVGIVPVALVAAAFEGQWAVFWEMLVTIAIVAGVRILGGMLAETAQ